MGNWPRTLSTAERAAILDDQVERFAWEGWRVVSRSDTTAQLTRPKRLSVWAAVFWALFLLVGLLVYLLAYLGRRDPVVRLVVSESGKVAADWTDGVAWPRLPGEWQCKACRYPNAQQRPACLRCAQHR